MKLYDSFGPNPRLVRMFLAEKNLTLPSVQVDIMAGENRGEAYRKKNPFGQLPALELDDGRVIGETVVICEYLEEKHPQPVLVGATPEERAETRMWTRRAVLHVIEPMSNAFRYKEALAMFKDRMRTIPQAADDLKALAQDGLELFDQSLAGRTWIAGSRFTLADIALYAMLDFFSGVGQPLDPALANLGAWFRRVGARPSADASVHPNAKAAKMRA
ncbi:MAG TPA: glutathione S-transferase family protein [Myxococcota bacterium]|nr:glutathione S-transferase family protein [Myxococcota bacterium]